MTLLTTLKSQNGGRFLGTAHGNQALSCNPLMTSLTTPKNLRPWCFLWAQVSIWGSLWSLLGSLWITLGPWWVHLWGHEPEEGTTLSKRPAPGPNRRLWPHPLGTSLGLNSSRKRREKVFDAQVGALREKVRQQTHRNGTPCGFYTVNTICFALRTQLRLDSFGMDLGYLLGDFCVQKLHFERSGSVFCRARKTRRVQVPTPPF
jgi:hypothetical protein